MDDDIEVLDPEEAVAVAEGEEVEQVEDETSETAATEAAEGEGDTTDEVSITIGDETPPSEEEEVARAPAWVAELRKSNREKDRRIRELEQKVTAATPAPAAVVVGEEPTLESFDYDTDKFKAAFKEWHQRKQAAETEAAKRESAAQTEKAAWTSRLEHHGKLKSELKVKDYDDAEAAVEAAMTVTQRGLIVHGAENSAQLTYALGKNPKTLKDLASITDPVKFAFAVAKLETKLKVTPRKAAPLPETTVRGNAPVTGDRKLEQLRAEADRTGDRTKVARHMKEVQAAKKRA